MDLRRIIALAAAGAVATTTALIAQPATDTKPATKPTQPEKKPTAPATTPTQPEKKPAQPATPSQGEEELAWMQAAMPTENHQRLEAMLGDWTVKAKFWMDPAAPVTEMEGQSKNTMILDGRWVRQDFTANFMNMPFTGLGYTGYDNIKKAYVGSWMDTMSTGMMTSEGQWDEASKSLTFTGQFTDPMGKKNKFRHVVKVIGPDEHTFTMYETKGSEAERKTAEMVYTRKK